MKKTLSHDEWISALNKTELSAFDIVQMGRDIGSPFIWHPLGFILCKLSQEGEKKIRLHIWPNNNDRMQNPSWLIHDHIFDLKSWVVAGEILNTEYTVADGKPNYRVYNAKYEKDSSVLYRTDRQIFIDESTRSLVRSGEVYSVLSGVLHQSVSLSETTSLTVCETIDQPNINPTIAGDINGMARYSYTRSEVDERDLRSIVDKI